MSTAKAKMTRKSIVSIGIVFLCLFISGSVWWWIQCGRIVSTNDARVKGTMTTISTKVSGRIAQILVEEGDIVEPGQPLAIIEEQEYANQVAQAEANLAMAQAKLKEIQTGNRPQEIAQAKERLLQQQTLYENSLKNYQRYQALFHQQAIAEQQLDAARTDMETALTQYQAAQEAFSLVREGSRQETILLNEAAVRQAEAVLENARIALNDTGIKAPGPGTIGKKSVEIGEYVSTGKPLFNITNLQDVWISANIEETEFGKIALGNPVDFTIDAYPGVHFTGEVFETSPATGAQFALLPTENASGNFTKVTQRLPIKIHPSGADTLLKPGMSAIVSIHVR